MSNSAVCSAVRKNLSALPLSVCEDLDTLNPAGERAKRAGPGRRADLGLCLRIPADLSFQAFWRSWSCLCLKLLMWCVRINRATLHFMPQRSTDTWTWSSICWGWWWRYGGCYPLLHVLCVFFMTALSIVFTFDLCGFSTVYYVTFSSRTAGGALKMGSSLSY